MRVLSANYSTSFAEIGFLNNMLHATLLTMLHFYDFARGEATYTPAYAIRHDYQLTVDCANFLKTKQEVAAVAATSRN